MSPAPRQGAGLTGVSAERQAPKARFSQPCQAASFPLASAPGAKSWTLMPTGAPQWLRPKKRMRASSVRSPMKYGLR